MNAVPAGARGARSASQGPTRLAACLLAVGLVATGGCKKKEKPSAPPPSAARSGVTALTSAPVCSADQDAEWNHVRQVTLGAAARDPVGHVIGRRPARKFLLINNWYPLDVVKQIHQP